jgi:hypothetical protein
MTKAKQHISNAPITCCQIFVAGWRWWAAWFPSAKAVRREAAGLVREHELWERLHARYDVKIGLLACWRVKRALDALPVSESARTEYASIVKTLRELMALKDLEKGEASTEAASIGSIIRLFEEFWTVYERYTR